MKVQDIPLSELYVDDANVRANPGDIGDLENSIAEQGFLEPIIVRKGKNGRYGVVIGSRRFHAAKSVGAPTIPAIVKELDDENAILESFAENIQRNDLSDDDTARVIGQFYEVLHSQRKVAQRLNISRRIVQEHLTTLGLIKAKDESESGRHAVHHGESSIGASVLAGEYDDENTPDNGSILTADTTKTSLIASTGQKIFPDDPERQVEFAGLLKDEPRDDVREITKQLKKAAKDGEDLSNTKDAIEAVRPQIPHRLSITVPTMTWKRLISHSEVSKHDIETLVLEAVEAYLDTKEGI